MTTTLMPPPERVAPATRPRRRRWPVVVAFAAGAVLLVGALIWRSVAVPALVKFPTDVEQTPRYRGTFTLFVDPATTAPLAEPTTSELAVERLVEGIPDESSASRVVVRETITLDVEGLASATQVHQYVMDRRSNVNVADDRAWAFDESNVLDRSDAYWVSLPKDFGATSTMRMYKDEVGATFTAVGTTETEVIEGLRLVGVESPETTMPLTEAYLRSLDTVVPLPRSLMFDELKPSLIAAGVPVDEAMAALLEVATPADLEALATLIGRPIPLEYMVTFGGRIYAEPDTGAIVDVASIVDRVGVRAADEALPPLLTILERYRDEPAVAAAIDGLDRLASEPLPVFEYRYAQTEASAAEIARWVSDQRDLMNLAERTIPFALAAAGVFSVVVGAILTVRLRAARPRRSTP